MILQTETYQGVDKVSRYGWQKRNEPGELTYIEKALLRVDHRYQRPFNDKKRLRIVANWNWAAFGVLIVARRKDNTLWLIDGQHRHAAAMSRSDVTKVPCVIFDFADAISEEATDFITANKERKPLTGVDTFRAQVVSGDPTALVVEQLVTASGRVIASNSGPTTVACVRSIVRCAETDARALRSIWAILCDLCTGAALDNRLLLGLFTLERRLVGADDRPRSLTEVDLRGKLIAAGVQELLRSISSVAAYQAKGGEKVYATGILNVLNHGRRNRLKFKSGTASTED